MSKHVVKRSQKPKRGQKCRGVWNDRGMEEMSEMWKDRKPDESRAQPLMRNIIAQMDTLDIWTGLLK